MPRRERFAARPPSAYMAGMDVAAEKPLTIDEVVADFEFLDDWEDRYRYVIELGRRLRPLPESERTDANKVRGCASQVWLSTRREHTGGGVRLAFRGDSDALIVRGLVAIVIALYDGKEPDEILAMDAEAIFSRLDLRSHLTAQRSNGLRSLVERIRSDAESALVAPVETSNRTSH